MTNSADDPAKSTDAILASYGRFCITFELAVFRLRSVIEKSLHLGGLSNQGIAQVLLANQTAEPLRALAHPILSHIKALTDAENKAISNVVNRFQSLTEQRNVVVHSTWFLMALGQDDVDYSTLDGFKYHRKKGMNSLQTLATDAQALDELTNQAQILADCFLALGHAVGFGKPIDSWLRPDASGVYLPNFKKYWNEA